MNPTAVRVYACEANFERLERVAALAKRKGASIAQVALAFLLTGPLNVFALTGPRSPAEFADNAAALNITLTAAERAWLDLKPIALQCKLLVSETTQHRRHELPQSASYERHRRRPDSLHRSQCFRKEFDTRRTSLPQRGS